MGFAQKLGYTAAWIDVEHSFSEDLARINGCEVDDIIYPNNSLCAEETLDVIMGLCRTNKVEKDLGLRFAKDLEKEQTEIPLNGESFEQVVKRYR